MRLKFPITVKLSALIVLCVIVTAFAVNEVYLKGSNEILINRAIHDLEQETAYFQYPLDGFINQLKDDVRFLSQLHATGGLMRAHLHNGTDPIEGDTEAKYLERLATTFREMLKTRDYYVRIRVIGIADEGRELLKVERFGNQVERFPDSKLQSKGSEAYFGNTLRLAPGDVYLSPIDLNKEFGKVSLPHMPVLRASVPLYTAEKEAFGIMIINMDFGRVLADVRRHMAENRALYVTNARGDYLLHPDASALYATDLGQDRRIQREYPKLVGIMGNPKQSQATLLPEDKELGAVFAFRKYHYDALNPEHYLGIAVEAPYRDIISDTAEVERRGLIMSLAITLFAAGAAVFFLRLSIRPLNRIADAVVRYRKGETTIGLPVDSPDEIGVLAKEFRDMMEQKNREDWVKENLVVTAKNLLGFKELKLFSDALIKTLCPAVGAQVGAFYISSAYLRTYQEQENEAIVLMATYGCTASASSPKQFGWGEGLVGQCAKDRAMRLVTEVPDDYLRIISALGDTKPKYLILLPVLFENSLAGVVELASVNLFSEMHKAFLSQLSFNAGVIINSISAGMRTQELLEEARATAEELQRSEEELKTQQEELQASNEELEEKTKALEEQNAQIQQQTLELEESKQLLEGKAQELERANKYKSEFLANMSHELRTPLNSLLILAKSLAGNEEGNLTEEQVEEATVIHNGGLELLSLINDILDLSKVEAGKINVVYEHASLEGIAKKMEQQFEPVAKEADITYRIRVAEGLPETIYTDMQRVEQILKNLLSNAFKFTERGSVILDIHLPQSTRELRRISLQESRVIGFSVTDTGIGIAEGKLKDIFEAFQQEDGSIDRHYGGTGLGLTIARKFAHLLGGEIHVKSRKGEGSAFTLYLPETLRAESAADNDGEHSFSTADNTPKQKAMPPQPIGEFMPDDRDAIGNKDKVLLIIEDDRNFVKTMMKIARGRGYKCLVAGDGKTGLLLATEKPVTAVILDLTLPDIDGINVLDQLKHDLKTRHIPVHIITGRENSDNVVPLRKGAVGYITKPVQEEDIHEVFGRIEGFLKAAVKEVLVVEDDEKSQIAIKNLLRKKDIRITVAAKGEDALRKVGAQSFDCVILDLRLPDMTGFAWLERLEKQKGNGVLPPVIIYTAKELSEEENRRLNQYTGSIVIKGASSSERLLDEVTLFLHSVASSLSKDQQAMIRMQHEPDKVLQGKKVLLVDDDLRNTFALSKMLKKHGMDVTVADNGQMALEKLRDNRNIELVIMDIMMPIMDGYQAMREMRAQKRYQALPIIALTARAMPEEQERCIAAGANDYLTKPVDVERLLTLMRVWLFRQEKAA